MFVRLVKNLNRSSYICGDYNIDLLKIKANRHFNDFFNNLITVGFFPKITLPTRFTEQSSSLIDNVFSNNIDERESSGILLNQISDHQFLFTYIEKLSYIERVPKFIDIEKNDANSLENFIQELNDMNIYDQLLKPIDSSPHENYVIFMKLIQEAKNTHFPKKTVKFNKKKHKKSKWMTYGILNSINKKDRLYKLLLKTDVNSDKYAALKATFKQYKETLRRSIKEAKKLYYHRTFLLYQNNVRKTWSVIKETLQRKKKHELPNEFVWNNHVITDMNEIGVPQGSVLGPLLFLIYINDLPLMSNIFSMLMYADDTTLYCNIDQHVNENDINVELAKLSEWLGASKLALNISKTKFMVFHTSNKAVKYPNLKINNTDIEHVFEFNFLGVIFNSHMNWNTHINYIATKISKIVGILYRLKDIYPQSVLLTRYNSLILPHFHYCLLLWGSSIKENHPLHLLQKKAVRIIDNSHYIAHTEPICKVHRLLKLPDMFSIALWKFTIN